MTAPSSWFTYRPTRSFDLQATTVSAPDVSIVIPVRNNLSGLKNLLDSIAQLHRSPLEVIVVDNLSEEPIELTEAYAEIKIIRCEKPGAAAARNAGAKISRASWIWFLDSDCKVQPDTLERFSEVPAGPIALCGRVISAHRKLLNRYYEEQEILMPQFAENDEPLYLVTASALIYRSALEEIGHFDERFPSAAGEDIDLGLRLFSRGKLAFVQSACVVHEFEECLNSFQNRFIRYGEGNRVLAEKYGISLEPTPFRPQRQTHLASTLAKIQFQSLNIGYSGSHALNAPCITA